MTPNARGTAKLLRLYRSDNGIWRCDLERHNGAVYWSSLKTRDERMARIAYQRLAKSLKEAKQPMSTKPLDRWARDYGGYSDFDTFIRAGGSIVDAVEDIRVRIRNLEYALIDIGHRDPTPILPYVAPAPTAPTPTITPEIRAGLEREKLKPTDEPADPDNAQIQGGEVG